MGKEVSGVPPGGCELCPRRCGARRSVAPGRCGELAEARVARAALHHWEEPCLSGTRGSGTVFFSGCGLGCRFCQNHEISRGGAGQPHTPEELAQVFLRLQAQEAHNLNLVTAGHHRPVVQRALALARAQGLALPVVWNTGGYELPGAVAALADDVDIWLLDLKFYSEELAQTLADAPDYFEVASAVAVAACAQAGPPRWGEDGLLQKGVVIRLLVLPGCRGDAKALLRFMADSLPKDGFLLSLMSQYTPPPGLVLPPPFNRRVASYEYRDVVETARALGLTQGYTQQRSSATAVYTPPFDVGR